MRELLLGCGSDRTRFLAPDQKARDWADLVTCDINADHRPDVLHDLNVLPWPFHDSEFGEVHAYEVLEHLGRQGDAVSFFAHFAEIWRVLKAGGFLCATVPRWDSQWAWGDPSHTRVISEGSLAFLSQKQYREQVGKTHMTDFRYMYKADFEPVYVTKTPESLAFILRAVK